VPASPAEPAWVHLLKHIRDDRQRLLFTCCHPVSAPAAGSAGGGVTW
jgi:predicted RNA polymerase sigma factor